MQTESQLLRGIVYATQELWRADAAGAQALAAAWQDEIRLLITEYKTLTKDVA